MTDDNTAFERLRREHQEVLARLSAFDAAAAALKADPESGPVPELDGFMAFIEEEVWTHFTAEEETLFPLLQGIFPSENAPIVGGPLFVLTEEHTVLRRLVARAQESLALWKDGEPDAREAFLLVAPQLVRAFQKHIYKEDNIVFRLAEVFLDADTKAAFEAAFNRFHA